MRPTRHGSYATRLSLDQLHTPRSSTDEDVALTNDFAQLIGRRTHVTSATMMLRAFRVVVASTLLTCTACSGAPPGANAAHASAAAVATIPHVPEKWPFSLDHAPAV